MGKFDKQSLRLRLKQSLVICGPNGKIQLAAFIAGSSNGRTQAFGAWYLGSNPSPAADSTRRTRSRLSAQLLMKWSR
ncbi:MAG: hypothetical protein UU03_C0004G0020 [Candidatus Woesebacteria bacterium GW2011_GWA1_40_45]|uniref:Uncharacterized protein n=2 Tax=Candidatus Woeseibacteriota TaxID=1752722 RepID=A0A0G0SF86_9BACT|nr:MAG: hypothetical protein UT72_C0005G0015 [Candidatus Woesebacteria bacterium GW2011_GWB1_40_101]KKR63449.1 MAG: hypothetical protein UU03_C0004G0020 [Candidatus Woesebacteria bacterium GW2011_GWA1_40_45]